MAVLTRRDPTDAGAWLAAHRRPLLVLSAVLALGVLAAWVLAKATGLFPPATAETAEAARAARPHALYDAAVAFAAVGQPLVAIAGVSALMLVTRARAGARAALLPLAAAMVVIPTTIAKDLPGRVTSLPSGHAAYAVAVGGYAAWLLLRAGRPRLAGALALLALAVAPARVVEGAHMTADVVAGVALGVAWLLAVLLLGRPWAAARRA